MYSQIRKILVVWSFVCPLALNQAHANAHDPCFYEQWSITVNPVCVSPGSSVTQIPGGDGGDGYYWSDCPGCEENGISIDFDPFRRPTTMTISASVDATPGTYQFRGHVMGDIEYFCSAETEWTTLTVSSECP